MKSRYKFLFQNLSLNNENCFIPFVVLGDPSIQVSLKIIDLLINNGADALELGIPFTDPIADGLIIQNSHIRALRNKITLQQCFNMINIIRNKHTNIPIGLLTYSNLVFCRKIPVFYSLCKSNGIDSVLIADLPLEESLPFRKNANKNNVSSVFICPPNSDINFIKKIIKHSKSYIYLVSRPGITGEQKINSDDFLKKTIKKLKKHQSPPIMQGFGIYKRNQIKSILRNGVNGIICGSCIIKIIEKNLDDTYQMMKKIKKIIIMFKKETKNI
ncbi:tryptophan synthase subunit alpha [Buchnera aphidicola]|uniref:Tryptophan synthase alpha chain n=1 Tax=Buchnera aphidicola (Cinara strobi) TaxID=1921549 RepID=A0A3B1DW47_9GAMM|nr:tryptophan synthase subunit alpha [Buchnera aphidicola]VAX76513.1 Tryptophan synthase alpha chain [Buchnera aphidicola (Cinara strobi)]